MNNSPEDVKHLWRISAPHVFRAEDNNYNVNDLVAIIAERQPDELGEGVLRAVTLGDVMHGRHELRQQATACIDKESARILEGNISLLTEVMHDIVAMQRKVDDDALYMRKIQPTRIAGSATLSSEELAFK